MYPKVLSELIESFKYFPGIGEKTAERLAFSVLKLEQQQLENLGNNLKNIKNTIKECKKCNTLSQNEICDICANVNRNKDELCIVEDSKSVFAIEKIGNYKGYYFVLSGLINSFDGINIENLRLDKLVKNIDANNYKEVIIAVKPCIEGEMTALYIKSILEDRNIKVTRLASGIPMGADMDYIDSLTLERAFDNRKIIS